MTRRPISQCKMQDLIELALLIVREWLAVSEAAATIQRKRWLERRSAPGFQAEAMGTASFCRGDDLLQNGAARTLSKEAWLGPHGLHLAIAVGQHLEGADAGKLIAVSRDSD